MNSAGTRAINIFQKKIRKDDVGILSAGTPQGVGDDAPFDNVIGVEKHHIAGAAFFQADIAGDAGAAIFGANDDLEVFCMGKPLLGLTIRPVKHNNNRAAPAFLQSGIHRSAYGFGRAVGGDDKGEIGRNALAFARQPHTCLLMGTDQREIMGERLSERIKGAVHHGDSIYYYFYLFNIVLFKLRQQASRQPRQKRGRPEAAPDLRLSWPGKLIAWRRAQRNLRR